nr:hypothetical protein [Clostridioides difficile]
MTNFEVGTEVYYIQRVRILENKLFIYRRS